MSKKENLKEIEKLLGKLMSEEWITSVFYKQMILACKPEERTMISEVFEKIAEDEYEDHYTKFLNFSLSLDLEVPCTIKDYMKQADKEVVKQYESFKKNQKAGYYIEQGIESESRTIQELQEIINNLEPEMFELKQLLLPVFYDEVEHLETLNTMLMAFNASMKVEF